MSEKEGGLGTLCAGTQWALRTCAGSSGVSPFYPRPSHPPGAMQGPLLGGAFPPPTPELLHILQGLFRHHPWKAFLLSWGPQSPPGHASVMAGLTVGSPTVLVLLRAGATSDLVCPQ